MRTTHPAAGHTSELPPAADEGFPPESSGRRWGKWLPDLAICLGLTAIAGWLAGGLWPHPATRAFANNVSDQALNEWWLAYATRMYTGGFHLVTHLLNSPRMWGD